MPAIPNLEDICAYVDMKVLNAISEGLYSNHVGSKAQAGDEQAQAVLAQEHKVAVFVEHLLHHIQVYGRRMHSGVSLLCRSLPEAAPILRRDCAAFVGDCEVLGLRKRPCCEIKFIRPSKKTLVMHHTMIQPCQLLWALLHYDSLLDVARQCFLQSAVGNSLSTVCEAWKTSGDRSKLVQFTHLIVLHIPSILADNNSGVV